MEVICSEAKKHSIICLSRDFYQKITVGCKLI